MKSQPIKVVTNDSSGAIFSEEYGAFSSMSLLIGLSVLKLIKVQLINVKSFPYKSPELTNVMLIKVVK